MKEILHKQNSAAISCKVYSDLLLDISAGNCHRALVDEIRNDKNSDGKAQ
jgi:hypothetical protein